MGGAAKNTKILADYWEAQGAHINRIRSSMPFKTAHAEGIRYYLKRFVHSFEVSLRMIWQVRRHDTIYMVPDGGLGIYLNLIFVLILSLYSRGFVWLHHRNYRKMVTKSKSMSIILWLLGDRQRHIFLEEKQAHFFNNTYGSDADYFVVSNAAICDVEAAHPAYLDTYYPITIGYLSNLNNEKGFDVVAQVFPKLAKVFPHVQFRLAGAPTDSKAAAELEKLKNIMGSRMSYVGHITGVDKEHFFSSLDIFLFPTRFRHEAQPNVLFEAMAKGAFLCSTQHALIPYMLRDAPHTLIHLGPIEQMVSDLVDALRQEVIRSADLQARLRRANHAIEQFSLLKASSKEALQSVTKVLLEI